MIVRKLLCLAGALVLCSASCLGQALNTSQLSGVVQDGAGASVPGATITATKTDTGIVRTTKSNGSGNYTFPDLPTGPYRLTVAMPGFATYVEEGIRLEVGSNPEINPKLTIGQENTQITVEATAGVTVETQSNGVGQVIDSKQVVELPLNGRDPTQLIALAGATTTAPAGDLNSNKNFPTITIAVAGGLPNGVAYVLDGGTHNDVFNNLNLPIPFPDALQEFKVETSSLPAQYGDHSSAAVNAITRSGGSHFHGSAFEFVRNYIFNAAPFFGYNPATGVKLRDNLKRNQFGGTIGGPIIPGKLFFFAGVQHSIIRATQTPVTVFAPTQDMLNGDFTVAINYKNPSTGLNCFSKTPGTPTLSAAGGFVGNKINPALYNQQALNIIKAGIPVTNDSVNNPCGATNVVLSQNSTSPQVIGRLDYTQNERHSMFARYYIARFNSPVTAAAGNLLTANQVSQLNQDQSVTIGDNYAITPNIVNSLRITGNRTLGQRALVPFFDPSSVGINAYTNPGLKGFTGVTVTNGFALGQGGNNPGYFNSTDYQLVDDVIFVRGNHTIALGGNYVFAYMNTVNNRPTNGAFTFAGSIYGGSTVGYADFLTGAVSSFSQGAADYENDVYHYVGAYVQDSWKPKKNLTLNYGVRFEPYIPFWNRNSHAEHFDMAAFTAGKISSVYVNAPAGLTFPGDPGFTGRSYNAGKLNQFAPRVGFVYDPSSNGTMSIRGGYGIFYDSPQLFFDTRFSNAPPWGQTITLAGVNLTNPFATYPGGNPFPGINTVSPTSTFAKSGTYVNMPVNFHPMYLQQYNLSIQKEYKGWLFSGSYLGNVTRHLPTAYEGNPAVYIAGNSTGVAGSCGGLATLPANGSPCSSTSNTNARRQLTLANATQGSYYSTIGQLDDGGVANYNGLLVSANRRGKMVNLVVNYTYAHCLSDAETTELTGPSYVIPGNRHASYSNCDSDRRQVANASVILAAPKFHEHLTNLFAGGWSLSTIFTARSGGYGTVTTGADTALSGIANQIAVKTGNPYGTRTRFGANGNLVASAFTAPALGTYTTSPPLTVKGPGSYELDMALLRNFRVTDSQSFQFRWEVFNVPNEAIFQQSATGGTNAQTGAVTSTTFGNFTNTADPRIMQFALKYLF